jgi:coproporphyrinogen III oxidase
MDINAVEQYLRNLQKSICDRLTTIDGSGSFEEETWDRPEGGGGVSRVLAEGAVFEKAGGQFFACERRKFARLCHSGSTAISWT